MGVDFYLKRLVLGNERNVNVQVWDVAGSALSGKMTDKVLYHDGRECEVMHSEVMCSVQVLSRYSKSHFPFSPPVPVRRPCHPLRV